MGLIDDKRVISDYPVKPRKFKGTPASRHRAILSAGLLGFCTILGVGYHFLDSSQKIAHYLNSNFSRRSVEQVQRASLLPVITGSQSYDLQAIAEKQGDKFEDTAEEKKRLRDSSN